MVTDPEIAALRAALDKAEQDRDTARAERASLEKRLATMTSACTNAAAAAESACRRLVEYQPVIEAADRLVDDPNRINCHMALHEAVETWRKTKPS